MTQQWGQSGQGGWPAPGAGQPGGFGRPSFGQGYGQQWPAQQGGWPQAPQQQGWPQPPQQQPGPWGPPSAAPKRRGIGRMLLLVGGVVAFAIIGLAVASSLSQPAYKNESYKVPAADASPPALPIPRTVAVADQALTANPLYGQKVAAPVRCDMSDIDAVTASDAQLKAHFEEQMACLMRVWGPTIDATKTWELYRPTVTIYGETITTPCGGRSGVNAFYCAANQQVYYSRLLARSKQLPTLSKPKMVDLVMAHEFGHAIQGRTAILGGMYVKIDEENPSTADQLWLQRRLEVQADCFSGMWLRSTAQSRGVTEQDVQNFYATLESLGDDSLGVPDGKGGHGGAASRRYWGQMGMSTDDVGRCNTWTAPQQTVR